MFDNSDTRASALDEIKKMLMELSASHLTDRLKHVDGEHKPKSPAPALAVEVDTEDPKEEGEDKSGEGVGEDQPSEGVQGANAGEDKGSEPQDIRGHAAMKKLDQILKPKKG